MSIIIGNLLFDGQVSSELLLVSVPFVLLGIFVAYFLAPLAFFESEWAIQRDVEASLKTSKWRRMRAAVRAACTSEETLPNLAASMAASPTSIASSPSDWAAFLKAAYSSTEPEAKEESSNDEKEPLAPKTPFLTHIVTARHVRNPSSQAAKEKRHKRLSKGPMPSCNAVVDNMKAKKINLVRKAKDAAPQEENAHDVSPFNGLLDAHTPAFYRVYLDLTVHVGMVRKTRASKTLSGDSIPHSNINLATDIKWDLGAAMMVPSAADIAANPSRKYKHEGEPIIISEPVRLEDTYLPPTIWVYCPKAGGNIQIPNPALEEVRLLRLPRR